MAIVADGAIIGPGCVVGPFCTIGDGVILGPGNRLEAGVALSGPVRIGEANHFYPHCVIGFEAQRGEHESAGPIEIGNRNSLREGVTIQGGRSAGGVTRIGDDCKLLAHCHVAHDCVVGDRVILSNSAAIAGHVVIEDDVQLSGLVSVHQFVRIGRLSLVAANSFVTRDILPFTIAAGHRALIRGHNRIGLQRAGWSVPDIEIVRRLVREYLADRVKQRSRLLFSTVMHPAERDWIGFMTHTRRGLAPGTRLARSAG